MSAPTILIVEDDHDIREMLQALLEEEHYRVETAINGRIALDLLVARRVRPDLILLDLMMPVLDGAGFLQGISTDLELKKIPVIMLTASHSGQGLDIAGYLKKPLDLDDLLERVRALLPR